MENGIVQFLPECKLPSSTTATTEINCNPNPQYHHNHQQHLKVTENIQLIRVRPTNCQSFLKTDEFKLDVNDLKNHSDNDNNCSTNTIRSSFSLANNNNNAYDDSSLPPVDRGFFAWRFVIVAFFLDGFVWGPPLSFGVFLNYAPYSTMDPSLATSIGTLSSGILYCIGVFLMPLMEKSPTISIFLPTIGTLLCCASWLGASYSDHAWKLLLFQGAIYGIGGSFLYYPALVFVSEWWVERRGIAGSIMFAGASIFNLFYPLVVDWSIQSYGTPKTLRGMAAAWFIGLAPLMPFCRGRLPTSGKRQARKKMGIYFSRPIFWALIFINFVQSLAFFVPGLYLPIYAHSIGATGGVTLALLFAASCLGQVICGYFSDSYDMGLLISLSCISSSLSVFLLWGLCNGKTMLLIFSVVYGLCAGGFSCLWHRFAMLVAPSDPNSGKLVVFFATTRGLANILTGPITGCLISKNGSVENSYKVLINYSGALMMICSIGVGIRMFYHKA